jgi:hypothetical protein
MTESILRTSEFKWDPVNQVRCGVSVDSVTRLFAENPFEVVSMDLSEWKLEDQGGRAAVVHCDAPGYFARNCWDRKLSKVHHRRCTPHSKGASRESENNLGCRSVRGTNETVRSDGADGTF